MEVGAFSVSLSVKDLHASEEFYRKLGFSIFGGNAEDKWLIMKNGDHIIGLFEGMFENNILTFNPGWDQNAEPLETFQDIRDIQNELKAAGISFESQADENSTGPASFAINDPDGNTVLFDQHV